jgi:hypothetical protein
MNHDQRSKLKTGLLLFSGMLIFFSAFANAQTSQFSYQGSMNASGSPANGSYDFEFKLYDAASGGTQIGSTISRNVVTVTSGTFSVTLDFQSSGFPGNDRYLEIAVRATGGGAFTTLAPRTQILSSPYSITSVSAGTSTNALNLGGIPAAQYVQTGDLRLSDSRNPTPGSPSYIQNNSGTPQASASLNIDGTATAADINALQYYKLGANRILFTTGSPNADSIFVGPNIALNSTGVNNSFFGVGAGTQNTTGAGNSFFGRNAGSQNTSGAGNAFFGANAGNNTSTGQSNAFVGNGAGGGNQAGSFNVYVGQGAGNNAAAGQSNTYIGTTAGASIGGGSNSNNVAVGADAGNVANLGSNNTFIGKGAISNQPGLNFATAIGSGVTVSTSNTIMIGRSSETTIIPGPLKVGGGAVGSIQVCATPDGYIGTCSSSKRYKSDISPYLGGLNVVNRLRPVSFTWTRDKIKDIGFVAEEVNSVESRLSVLNKDGVVEGIKFNQLTAVLVNAVKEQQQQIEKLRAEIDVLKALVKMPRKRVKRTK